MAKSYVQRLKLRLFLEGVEVPVIAAQIDTAPNSPAVAAIQIPPLAEGTKLLPRTMVHLFFLDLYAHSNPEGLASASGVSPKKYPSLYEKSLQQAKEGDSVIDNFYQDARNHEYKLLFGGEVAGFQWTKNQNNRSIVLQCVDWSNYWDYAYQWSNTDIFGPGIKAVFSGGATNLFTDFLSSKGEVITHIVTSGKCNSFPKLKGLAAGIVRLIEAIGGSYYVRPDSGKTAKRFAGQNIFFSLAELRLHITQMIAAYSDDNTSMKLLRRQGYSALFNRVLGQLGQQTSIRQAISALTAVIFHETYPQPCPLYKPGLDGTVAGEVRIKYADDPSSKLVLNVATTIKRGVQDIIGQITALQNGEGTKYEDIFGSKVVGYNKKVILPLQARLASQRTLINRAMTQMRKSPEAARSAFVTSAKLLREAEAKLKTWNPKTRAAVREYLLDRLRQVTQQMSRVENLTVSKTDAKNIEPARLNQQILRPDIWFGAPPRCNVLFPENYFNMNYARMFLQEPTRLLLKTNDEFFGEDELFDKFYFAPAAGGLKKDHKSLVWRLGGDLLEHELFTGILPVFEKMGEFNVFAAQSWTGKQPAPKIGFAQRSTNFLYFKHRFTARKMSIVGRFNPYIAVGFPGLVIDKYVDRETLRLHNELRNKEGLSPIEITEILGTNFLGNFSRVTHAVSQEQQSGQTIIDCSYARQVEESIEFLGAAEKAQTVRVKVGEARRATDIAAVEPPKVYGIGPYGGRIISVLDVSGIYKSTAVDDTSLSTLQAGRRLPVFQRGIKTAGKGLSVPIGVSIPASMSPSISEYLNGEGAVVFSAFRVTEEVPKYRRDEIEMPAEEFIRPGWYGDVWTNAKIGRVYEDFIGTGAITDGQTITDPMGAGLGVPDPALETAQGEAGLAESAEDVKLDAPAAISLKQGSTIQQAAEYLVLSYSYIKQNNLNIDEFINSYTWRPVASMVDMFGTTDLTLSSSGKEVLSGLEGFHSRAFGPYEDIFGLVTPEIEEIVGIQRDSIVAARGDTRKRKYEAVQSYVSALRFSRALLG